MSTDSSPTPLRARVTALTLVALLVMCASPVSTAAQSPLDGLPPGEPVTVNQIVVYDAASGTTEIMPMGVAAGMPAAALVPGYNPLQTLAPEDFGALGQVTNPADWPWRGHVRLFQTYPAGGTSGCSGVLLDSMHVLTAGHCVWTHEAERCNPPDTGCWPVSMRIIPAYENGSTPFGEAGFANLWAWTAWTNDKEYDWDMSLIKLDRPVGALTGWYGFGYNNDDSFFTGGNTFRSTGYPGDLPYDGELMYTWAGTLDRVETYRLAHSDYAYGGQSGSGLYRDDSNRIVYGTASHVRSITDWETVYVRITPGSFTTLIDWIGIGTPDSVDLVPLDVNVSPGVLDRGDEMAALSYFIHNASEATWNGTVSLGIYLSADSWISGSDRQISTRSWTGSLGPKASIRISAGAPLPSIPGELCGAWPGGSNYWIGVIANVADANTGNNDSSGFDAERVLINACDYYEIDDTWSEASVLHSGQPQLHDIVPVDDVDWARFVLTEVRSVRLETTGSSGDTRLWLYDSGLAEIGYDDDGGEGAFSRIDRCLAPGTYYVQVDEYNRDNKIYGYTLSLRTDSSAPATCGRGYLPLVVNP